MSEKEQHDLSRDALLNGELMLWQSRKGYRFGLDSALLATDLPPLAEDACVVELGAGQGAVSLIIAHQNPTMRVVAVERQPSLLALLERNVAENGLKNVEIVAGDLREHRRLLAPHMADLVICNPPFFAKGHRRPSQQAERAAARHELFGGVADFIRAAAYVLDQRGWLQMITPPLRLADVLAGAEATDLRLASLRFYHSRVDEPAYLTEYRFRRGQAADLEIRPPLYIYAEQEIYTPEVARRVRRERR